MNTFYIFRFQFGRLTITEADEWNYNVRVKKPISVLKVVIDTLLILSGVVLNTFTRSDSSEESKQVYNIHHCPDLKYGTVHLRSGRTFGSSGRSSPRMKHL